MLVQKFHEMVMQMLFSTDFSGREEDLVELIMEQLKVTKKTAKEAYARVQLIMEKLETIDQKIREASTEYQFERISQVEKNVIRWGIFELLYGEKGEAIYAEALRLCRKFGTPSSARFVHAILEKVCPLKSASNQENS